MAKKKLKVKAATPVGKAMAAILPPKVADVVALEDAVREGSVDGVHDMRIATKRLREATKLFLPAFGRKRMKRHLGHLEQLNDALGAVRDHPKHPFVLILGGAKVSDKIGVIENMLGHVDSILVGGGMAFTFLKAQGKEIGKSLCEAEKLDFSREMLDRAREKGIDFLLPEDAVVAPELKDGVLGAVVSADAMPEGQMGLDIGPRTADRFTQALKSAQTVLWNGPMGVFEIPAFVEGSQKLPWGRANSRSAHTSWPWQRQSLIPN